MKICGAQTRAVPGDVEKNIGAHKKLIELAVAAGASVIFFPELSLTGYEPSLAGRLATTIDDARLDELQVVSDANLIHIAAGMPVKSENGITISMILFSPGKDRRLYSKKYLHADEEPFFVPGDEQPEWSIQGEIIALAICYELSIAAHTQDAFKNKPVSYVASVAKTESGVERAAETLSRAAIQYSVPVLMVNAIGAADNFQNAGKTAAWNAKGELIASLSDDEEAILVLDTATEAAALSYPLKTA